jgi:hypothetical protein
LKASYKKDLLVVKIKMGLIEMDGLVYISKRGWEYFFILAYSYQSGVAGRIDSFLMTNVR